VTEGDVAFIKRLVAAGLIPSPCLELGTGYDGPNCKPILETRGIEHFGTDLAAGENVDIVANFEDDLEVLKMTFSKCQTPFRSALVLNVLEHTFDPIRVLDNVLSILDAKGTCVVVVPSVWTLHDFPRDCWRINPNFFEEFVRRRGFSLNTDWFEYVGFGRIDNFRDAEGHYTLPNPIDASLGGVYSRAVHRIFNTRGRGMMLFSHVAIGAVITK